MISEIFSIGLILLSQLIGSIFLSCWSVNVDTQFGELGQLAMSSRTGLAKLGNAKKKLIKIVLIFMLISLPC